MMLRDSPIRWKCKKQQIVSKSSSEAEYKAISSTASKVTRLSRLLQKLIIKVN